MSAPGNVGYFGKLPGLGDFVQSHLPPAFVSTWDGCFEAAVDAAKSTFGERWHAVWKGAPMWRFALAPGVCGPSAWVGVTGPAVDRVNRCFPMVLAHAMDEPGALARAVALGAGWFGALEQVWRNVDAATTAASFDVALLALPDPLDGLDEAAAQAVPVDWSLAAAWRLPWRPADEEQLATVLQACLDAGDGCLWWTHGSGAVPASILASRGLPAPDAYAAFLDAQAAASYWHTQGPFAHSPVDAPASVGESASAALPMTPGDDLSDLLFSAPDGDAEALEPASEVEPVTAPVVDAEAAPDGPPPAAESRGDDLSDLLFGADARGTGPTGSSGEVALAAAGDTAPAEVPGQQPAGTVVYRSEGGTTLVAADNGPGDARREGALRVGEELAGRSWPPDPTTARECLLRLHPSLHARREDLLDPVLEDVDVVMACVVGEQASLLRVGAAVAWHWRRGQLQPLFVEVLMTDTDVSADDDDLIGVLTSTPTALGPGLGRADEPRCDEDRCAVAAGDRLVMLATDACVRLSSQVLAPLLAGATCAQAAERIAAAAGLRPEHAPWPLAVMEVGT